jgi:ribose transport system substrate-binding protein
MIKRAALFISCLILTALLSACDSGENPKAGAAPADKKISLAVIPKGTTHVFWKSVEAGARAAAKDLDVEMQWKGPVQENDRNGQIQVVEQFASQGVSGIVLAPLDDQALVRPVRDAAASNIPVVIIDSDLKGEAGKDFISFVATNNRKGGEMGGEKLAALLNNKGKVVLLRYLEGSASTREREEGFLSVMATHPEIQVISSNRYGGPNAGDAKSASLQLIDLLKQADGIFCSNEPMVFGMLLALRESGLGGKIKFVGFDASPDLIKAMETKEIDALVIQDPTRMGYLGVEAMVKHLRGENVETRIDSGVALVTPENITTPEIKKMLGRE